MKSIVPIDSKLGLWEASESGSSGWDRTNDLVVNSHPLYR